MGIGAALVSAPLLVRWDLGRESGSRPSDETPALGPSQRGGFDSYALQVRAEGLDTLADSIMHRRCDFDPCGATALANEADPISHSWDGS